MLVLQILYLYTWLYHCQSSCCHITKQKKCNNFKNGVNINKIKKKSKQKDIQVDDKFLILFFR